MKGSRAEVFGSTLQKATRRPSGDQLGWMASRPARSLRSPVSIRTAQTWLVVPRPNGVKTFSSPTASSRPSGDQHGLWPRSVTFRADSPVAPMMKMPPPAHSER
ncbi:MAG: hypothetical protein IPP07_24645 [Holophagales bacterium]|nr:hypothetical protein [Holophagales bacterium]